MLSFTTAIPTCRSRFARSGCWVSDAVFRTDGGAGLSDLETRLRRVEAVEAIRSTIFSYAIAGDQGNESNLLRRCFTVDATYEAKGMGRFEGLERIVDGLAQIGRDVVVWSFHAPGGPLIKLAEDTASAEAFWWVWVPVCLKDDAGQVTPHWGAGHYNATLVRSESDAWRFKRVYFETRLRTPFAGPWTTIEGPFEWPH